MTFCSFSCFRQRGFLLPYYPPTTERGESQKAGRKILYLRFLKLCRILVMCEQSGATMGKVNYSKDKQARHKKIVELLRDGFSKSGMAKSLGVSRTTIREDCAALEITEKDFELYRGVQTCTVATKTQKQKMPEKITRDEIGDKQMRAMWCILDKIEQGDEGAARIYKMIWGADE